METTRPTDIFIKYEDKAFTREMLLSPYLVVGQPSRVLRCCETRDYFYNQLFKASYSGI